MGLAILADRRHTIRYAYKEGVGSVGILTTLTSRLHNLGTPSLLWWKMMWGKYFYMFLLHGTTVKPEAKSNFKFWIRKDTETSIEIGIELIHIPLLNLFVEDVSCWMNDEALLTNQLIRGVWFVTHQHPHAKSEPRMITMFVACHGLIPRMFTY